MALSSSILFEVRTTGATGNGGGFKPSASGTDRSQQDSPYVTIDGTTITAVVHSTTTQITLTGFTVSAADVGNVFQDTGGTATAGFYEITAVDTVNNRWTLDRSIGTATQTVIGAMGGALSTMAKVEAGAVAGNGCYVKAGTYTVAASPTAFTRGQVAGSDVNWYEGYGATRGDQGTRPVFQATASSVTLLNMSNSTYYVFSNLAFDGNSQTGSHCINGGNGSPSTFSFYGCSFTGFVGVIINPGGTAYYNLSGCVGNGAAGGAVLTLDGIRCNVSGCEFYGFTTTPFANFSGAMVRTIIRDCSGSSTDGVSLSTTFGLSGGIVEHCTIKNVGRNCIRYASSGGNVNPHIVRNNLLATPGASGYCIANQNWREPFISGNAFYVNGGAGGLQNSGSTKFFGAGNVTLTADPFVDAAHNNLALNNTAGGGAACRGAAVPGLFPGALSTGYADIGAVQSQGGGGGSIFGSALFP